MSLERARAVGDAARVLNEVAGRLRHLASNLEGAIRVLQTYDQDLAQDARLSSHQVQHQAEVVRKLTERALAVARAPTQEVR